MHKTKLFFGLCACLMLGLVTFEPTSAQDGRVQRDFFQNAVEAGKIDRWQMINWLSSMDAAKKLAAKNEKPILVVMHNNFGGDTNSHDC